MDNLTTFLLTSISFALLVYNFILGKKLNAERNKEIQELEKEIKEKRKNAKKANNSVNDLIDKYRKLGKGD